MATPETPAVQISVLIVDDQRLVRAGFRAILEVEPDLVIVGEAGDGRHAIDLVARRSPDVVLLDIRMPEMDGLTAARRIVAESESSVLILTTFDADEYVFEALRAGASGFLLKDVPPEQLCWAIRSVANGDALIDPRRHAPSDRSFRPCRTAGRGRSRATRRAHPARARRPASRRPGALERRDRA